VSEILRVAAIQMTSGSNVDANLTAAQALIEEAAQTRADLVVLPENFALFGATEAERAVAAEPLGRGPMQAFLARQARRHGVWLVGGTVPLRADGHRASAAALLFDPAGGLQGRYDKIHLFDVDIPGPASERYRESDATLAGHEARTFDTTIGRLAIAVCYDLRFPALFHRMGQSRPVIVAVPAAFTVATGRAHWRVLLQARAIESMTCIVAAAQSGTHDRGRETYGHSMIVGPWGEVLAERTEGAGVISADLDIMQLNDLRARFPALDHRREL
jgi:predicted amidohydrolase